MNADGSNQARPTRNLDADLDPAWSPNGRQLSFTTNRDANNEIYAAMLMGQPDEADDERLRGYDVGLAGQ